MWRPLQSSFGLMNIVDDVVSRAGTSLPDFEQTPQLLCATDYSGQHKPMAFETYAFLIVGSDSWHEWEASRLHLRSRGLRDRTMSFKGLNDRIKRKALPDFLETTELLYGVLVTVAIEKRIGSLFSKSRKFDFVDLDEFQHYGPQTFERLMRVVHFLSLFIAGLSYPRQDLLWFSDSDAIAANPDRVQILTTLFANISSHYLSHNLGDFRCGTTSACDAGTMQIEDLCSIADLSAGATSELLTAYIQKDRSPTSQLIVPAPANITRKARYIGSWLAKTGSRLARLVISIESGAESGEIVAKRVKFHNFGRALTIVSN